MADTHNLPGNSAAGLDRAVATRKEAGILSREQWAPIVAALLMAVFFGAYAMRGAWETAPVYPDASRHALNGALLLDMVREGGWIHPVQFASQYYAHLPAITIPYHPPLFPLFEAAVFSIAGVSTASARLSVALCVGASAFLLFLSAREAGVRFAAALAAVAACLLTRLSQSLATDVLLEFPSLVLVVASALLIQRAMSPGTAYRGLVLAGLCAAAAVWTKQNTVFLLGIPACMMLLRREWKALRAWRFWAFHVIAFAGFATVMLLAHTAEATGNTGWRHTPVWQRVPQRAMIYADAFGSMFGSTVTIISIIGLAYLLFFRAVRGSFRNLDVYLAWIATSIGLLLVLPPWDMRYLFYTLPPLAIVLFAVVDTRAFDFGIPTGIRVAVLGGAAAAAFAFWHAPARQVDGFDDAARFVASRAPRRVLVLSNSNGAFTFEFRARQAARNTFLLRGHGLPTDQYRAPEFLRILHDLGVEYVVLHDSSEPEPWEVVQSIEDERLLQEAAFETRVTGQEPGVLRVYRFTNPSKNPRSEFVTPSSIGTGKRLSVLE